MSAGTDLRRATGQVRSLGSAVAARPLTCLSARRTGSYRGQGGKRAGAAGSGARLHGFTGTARSSILHRGPEALRAFYTGLLAHGGLPLQARAERAVLDRHGTLRQLSFSLALTHLAAYGDAFLLVNLRPVGFYSNVSASRPSAGDCAP